MGDDVRAHEVSPIKLREIRKLWKIRLSSLLNWETRHYDFGDSQQYGNGLSQECSQRLASLQFRTT
jgi:hypothetical protein